MVAGFITVACMSSVLVGTFGVINIVQINHISSNMYNGNLVPLTPLYNISTDFLKLQSQLRDEDSAGYGGSAW
jgi:hypothetical protein